MEKYVVCEKQELLNEKQQRAFDIAVGSRENVFITGSGGCGKTFTIKKIVKEFNENKINHAITASTGAAALLIGGITIHRWSGCDVFKCPATVLGK